MPLSVARRSPPFPPQNSDAKIRQPPPPLDHRGQQSCFRRLFCPSLFLSSMSSLDRQSAPFLRIDIKGKKDWQRSAKKVKMAKMQNKDGKDESNLAKMARFHAQKRTVTGLVISLPVLPSSSCKWFSFFSSSDPRSPPPPPRAPSSVVRTLLCLSLNGNRAAVSICAHFVGVFRS